MDMEVKPDFTSYTSAELAKLYKDDPDLFDELAAEALKRACIGSTPEQTLKLRQMQWGIDAQLRKGKTPLERMHIMENIFYGRVYGDDGYLEKLSSACDQVLRAFKVTCPVSGEKARMRLVKNS